MLVVLVVMTLCLAVTTGCRTGQAAPESPGPKAPYADVVTANTAFGLELYPHVRGSAPNLVYSPLSISTALAMSYAGARHETAAQIARALQVTNEADLIHRGYGGLARTLSDQNVDSLSINLVNSLWIQGGISYGMDFLQVLEREYRSEMRQVDFQSEPEAAREIINEWVSERTRELIPNLLSPDVITGETRLVLVNALYFKGEWARGFSKEATSPGPFYLTPNKSVEVPMMRQESSLRHESSRDHDIVELPYANSTMSMVLVVPKRSSTREFLGASTAASLNALFDGLKSGKVDLTMPKFQVRSPIALKGALAAMGMRAPFDPDQADFSPITRDISLYISHVAHEATITVDEIGTEAAAATAVVMVPTSANIAKPVKITFDRPFVFFLRDRDTGAILFMGELQDPS